MGSQFKGLRGSWGGVPWGTRARSPAGETGSVGALEKERGRRAMTGGSARSVGARATRLRDERLACGPGWSVGGSRGLSWA